jgi:hypothetical protein
MLGDYGGIIYMQKRHLPEVRGWILGAPILHPEVFATSVLQMLEDVVINETTNYTRTEGSPPNTQ